MLRGRAAPILTIVLLACGALTATGAAAASCPPGERVCEYQQQAGEATPFSESTATAPGAIEPLPVNVALMEQFWAGVEARRRRAPLAAALPAGWSAELVPDLQAGDAGWCLRVNGASPPVPPRCPVSPAAGQQIEWEGWEADGAWTRGFVLTGEATPGVAVDEGHVAYPVTEVTGFGSALGAGGATIAASFPSPSPIADEFDPVVAAGIRLAGRGFAPDAFSPGDSYPAGAWSAPAHSPAGACTLSARRSRRLRALSGSVLPSLTATGGIAGRGLLSCASTSFAVGGARLRAAVLLDAPDPAHGRPSIIPGAIAVRHHQGLYAAPGRAGEILARRAGHAWLVVEGGSPPSREALLAVLSARVAG